MFQNKKILMICKETFSYPLYFFAKDLIKQNSMASYFFNPAECCFNKTILNQNTYYKHRDLENLEVYDSVSITKLFTDNINNPPVDLNYINYIEDNYTNF